MATDFDSIAIHLVHNFLQTLADSGNDAASHFLSKSIKIVKIDIFIENIYPYLCSVYCFDLDCVL